jgi:hypothetical protein
MGKLRRYQKTKGHELIRLWNTELAAGWVAQRPTKLRKNATSPIGEAATHFFSNGYFTMADLHEFANETRPLPTLSSPECSPPPPKARREEGGAGRGGAAGRGGLRQSRADASFGNDSNSGSGNDSSSDRGRKRPGGGGAPARTEELLKRRRMESNGLGLPAAAQPAHLRPSPLLARGAAVSLQLVSAASGLVCSDSAIDS